MSHACSPGILPMIGDLPARLSRWRPATLGALPVLLPYLLLGVTPVWAEPASPTATALATDPNPAAPGAAVGFTVSVSGRGSPTGTVTLSEYPAGALQSATLIAGHATFSLPGLAPGLHLLTADYAGGAGFMPSTSTQLTLRVGPPQPSLTSMSVDQNPSAAGERVTLAASVTSAAGFGVATGTMTFRDGQQALGTVPLAALAGPGGGGGPPEQVSLSVPLSAGTHSLNAAYSGDGNLSASVSAAWIQVVGQKIPTATNVTSTANPALSGATTLLSATVTPTAPTASLPSGSLTFRDGDSVLGKVKVSAGDGTLPVTLLGAGSHAITAAYSGDPDFVESTSPGLPLEIVSVGGGPAPTAVALTATRPALAGAPLVLSAAVTGPPGTAAPTGDIYVADESGSVLGRASTDSAGRAILSLPPPPAGLHRLTATYQGDATYASSSSLPVSLTVLRTPVAFSLTSSANPSPLGQEVTLAATARPADGGTATPTGAVAFADETGPLGTAALDAAGSARLTTTALAAGEHHVTATYEGDGDHAGDSATFVQAIGEPAATATHLQASPTRVPAGQAVRLVATVAPSTPVAGRQRPAGAVIFRDGDTVLGVDELEESDLAALQVPALAPGTHSITAHYGGDPAFAPSEAELRIEVAEAGGP